VVAEWQTLVGPGRSVTAVWQRPPDSCEGEDCQHLGVQLLDAARQVLAQMGAVGRE